MSAFKESDQVSLEKAFVQMLNPTLVNESVDSSKKEEKTVVVENDDKEIVVESTEEETSIVGSKFNEIFKSVFSENLDEVEGDLEVSYEGGEDEGVSDEEEMVSVPVAVVRELYDYIDDTMGPEDSDAVDDVEFDLPEEGVDVGGKKADGGNKPKADGGTINRNKQVGSTTVNDKTKTKGVGKTGVADEYKKDRVGKPEALKSVLANLIQTGSKTQKGHALKKGDQPHNK